MSLPNPLLVAFLIFVLNAHGTTTILAEGKSNLHIVYLGEKQHDDPSMVTDSHHDLLASVVGSKQKASESIVYSYKHGFSGFAAKLTESQVQQIAELPGVVRIIPNSLYKLQTTRSWDFLGLSSKSQSNLIHKANKGDGVIIGIFDSGIWPESKSFMEDGLGPIPSRWRGTCQSGEQFNATQCNRKIVGARWYVDGFLAEYGQPLNSSGQVEFLSPRDALGHGTHTAGTAAGAFVPGVSYKGLAVGTARGGAPSARIAVYKVCWNVFGGQCASADILKAFDDAMHDGVDVLSLSLGGFVPFYSEVDERDGIATGSFHAVAKGIPVICAGVNDGPSSQTVGNVAPWILTVAASSLDRTFPSPITLGNNQTLLGQSLYTTKEIGFTSLLYPESNEQLNPSSTGDCESLSLNETSVNGKVVLCFTSVVRRSVIANAASQVREAGGVGLIVAKHQSDALAPCSGDFPCIHVDYEVGTKIVSYIRSTRIPLVKLIPSRTVEGKPVSPIVAYFSSRGPNSVAPAILKPDISAPGVNILAATSPFDDSQDNGFIIKSGTSMSTPHVSGIVALLKAAHPSWSPAAIRSALVTTATRTGPSGQPIFAEGSPMKLADSFDFGGGLVDPNAAADPGLVFDMGTSDYINYLCAMNYNNSAISRLTGNAITCQSERPSILDVNLPSITIPSIGTSPITMTRTVTNVGAQNSVYRAVIEPPYGILVSVKPEILVFNSRVKQLSFKVTMSTAYQVNTEYLFGSLIWTDRAHLVRIPLSVKTEKFQPLGEDY